ncbi:MAG: hypothetical protein ACI4EU_02485 [Butyrivibrio sp.]
MTGLELCMLMGEIHDRHIERAYSYSGSGSLIRMIRHHRGEKHNRKPYGVLFGKVG